MKGPAIKLKANLDPPSFDRTLKVLVHKYAKDAFFELGKDWDDVIQQSELRLIEQFIAIGNRGMKDRRGKATLKAPFEQIYDYYRWEVIRDGDDWVFVMGGTSNEGGKELRRLEYQRRPRFEVLKKDAPVRPGRPRNEDKETLQFQFGLSMGPIREAKHTLLESWDYQGPPGHDYKWTDVAPFVGRCIQIFNDAINHANSMKGTRR